MTTPDRFDLIHEQYLDEWVTDNLRHLYEVYADYLPWNDALTSSDEKGEDPWVSTATCSGPTGTTSSGSTRLHGSVVAARSGPTRPARIATLIASHFGSTPPLQQSPD